MREGVLICVWYLNTFYIYTLGAVLKIAAALGDVN